MLGNKYEGLFSTQETKQIRRQIKQVGLSSEDAADVMQEVVVALLQSHSDWSLLRSTKRKQLLWGLTRDIASKSRRSMQRQRCRDERKAITTQEAYYDKTTSLCQEVQDMVGSLDQRQQSICELLSQGLSKSQIAERMGCKWHTVNRLVATIRLQFKADGFGEDIQ